MLEEDNMVLRVADNKDLTIVVDFCKKFHSTTLYKDIEFNIDKVSLFINHLILDKRSLVLLLEEDGKAVGCILSSIEEIIFGIDTIATEIMFWVEEDYRGKNSWELVKAYQYWANIMGSKICSLSALQGPLMDKLDYKYKQLGFNPVEHTYMKVF